MKFTTEQLLLSAHVRSIATDLFRQDRNRMSEKWHSDHPGERRAMQKFGAELEESVGYAKYLVQAVTELESVANVLFNDRAAIGPDLPTAPTVDSSLFKGSF